MCVWLYAESFALCVQGVANTGIGRHLTAGIPDWVVVRLARPPPPPPPPLPPPPPPWEYVINGRCAPYETLCPMGDSVPQR